jgi:GNAT superfamily N-acetyltransferase
MAVRPKSSVVARFQDCLRRLGPVDCALYSIAKAAHAVSGGVVAIRRYYLFAQPLSAFPPRASHRGASIAVRRLTPTDAAIARMPRPAPELAGRFAAGSECLLAEREGKVIGFLWLHLGPYDDPETGVRFVPSPLGFTAWDFDVFVDPEHRASFALHRLWSEAAAWLRSRHVAHSVSLIWYNNDRSIRSHQRLGAFIVGSGLQIRVGRWTLHLADRAPRVRLLRPGAPRPAFEVSAQPRARFRRE